MDGRADCDDFRCNCPKMGSWLPCREKLVRPERFELPTYSSGGCRSIQLSYGRAEDSSSVNPSSECPQTNPWGDGRPPRQSRAKLGRCRDHGRDHPSTAAIDPLL